MSKQPYRSLIHDRIICKWCANASLVAKNVTKKIIPLLWIKSSQVYSSLQSYKIEIGNLSFLDDFIHNSGIIFLVPFLATKETLAPPENNLIMSGTSKQSFRHLEHQNPSIISEDIGRARSMQQFQRRRRSRSQIGGVGTQLS